MLVLLGHKIRHRHTKLLHHMSVQSAQKLIHRLTSVVGPILLHCSLQHKPGQNLCTSNTILAEKKLFWNLFWSGDNNRVMMLGPLIEYLYSPLSLLLRILRNKRSGSIVDSNFTQWSTKTTIWVGRHLKSIWFFVIVFLIGWFQGLKRVNQACQFSITIRYAIEIHLSQIWKGKQRRLSHNSKRESHCTTLQLPGYTGLN